MNYLDISNIYSTVKQFEYQITFFQEKIQKISFKNLIVDNNIDNELNLNYSYLNNYINKQLNKILIEFEPNNKINKLKDKIKEMFCDPNQKDFFLKRPLEKEWIEYSADDVKYLLTTVDCLIRKFEEILKKFYPKISLTQESMNIICKIICSGHLKTSCNIFSENAIE